MATTQHSIGSTAPVLDQVLELVCAICQEESRTEKNTKSSKKRCMAKCVSGERKNLRCKRRISSEKDYCEVHERYNSKRVRFSNPIIAPDDEDIVEVKDVGTQTEESDDDYPELSIVSDEEFWIDYIPSYIA